MNLPEELTGLDKNTDLTLQNICRYYDTVTWNNNTQYLGKITVNKWDQEATIASVSHQNSVILYPKIKTFFPTNCFFPSYKNKHIGYFTGFSFLHYLSLPTKSQLQFHLEDQCWAQFADFEPVDFLFACVTKCVWTHCVCGEFRWIVVDISNLDDSGGRVGQAVGGVSLHVCSLNDQCVLGDFLETERD